MAASDSALLIGKESHFPYRSCEKEALDVVSLAENGGIPASFCMKKGWGRFFGDF